MAAISAGTVKTTWKYSQSRISAARCLDPRGACQRLTLGTVPIRAGVVRRRAGGHSVALLDMPAERGGAARLDRGHDAPLRGRQRRAGVLTIGVAVAAEHVRHLQRRAIHDARRSEVLRVARATAPADGTWEQVQRARRSQQTLRRGDAQIAGGGRQTAMAEQQLNRADVGAGFQEVDGKRVAKRMRRDGFGNADSGDGPADRPVPRQSLADRLPGTIAGKQPVRRPAHAPPRRASISSNFGREHHVAILLALPLLDAQDHPLAVDVGGRELNGFGDAQAGGVAGRQDRAMLGLLDAREKAGPLPRD